MTQVTWGWRRADGIRIAYRGRLCASCFASKIAPLAISYKGVDALTCPSCGIGTEDDMDAVYSTSYIPGYGEFRTESPFCGACAATYRVWVLDHSWQLEDQRGAAGGPTTHPSGDEVLRSMGIVPRAD
jgi:hypothetical protein